MGVAVSLIMDQMPRRIPIARTPTPLEPLKRLRDEWGVELYVKRDDLTGSTLSGNKIRKLEYLFAEAIEQGCDTVITCGAVTSNHARATAIAARTFGLECHLVLAGDPPGAAAGNLQLDLLSGATVNYISRDDYSARVEEILEETKAALSQHGKKAYAIPTGGSNSTGLFGYVSAANELKAQCSEMNLAPDVVCCAVGSCGTYAGLVLGAALHELSAEVQGVLVCGTVEGFGAKTQHDIDEAIERFGLNVSVDPAKSKLVDGYIAGGYAQTNSEQLRFLRHVAQTEGLVLDPVYTNKAFFGLYNEIKTGRIAQGARVVFVHTGGIFGLSAFSEKMTEEWGSVTHWPDA